MSDYEWVTIDTRDDFDKIIDLLAEDFEPKEVVRRLKDAIRPTVRGILIERDYVDKDYRSTYYRYYAKKGRSYRQDCIRLHFFDAEIGFDADTTDLCVKRDGVPLPLDFAGLEQSLQGHYFGFVVLRPTLRATIGRSILSPDIRIGAKGHAIQAKHRVHLLGHRLSVWGFPSMAQHADIAVCAHVSCWSILRHYSERFPEHREWLLHDITMMAAAFDPGGLAPSLGLYLAEAERVFQAAGTFPLSVSKQPDESGATDEAFYAQLLAYLESGFPLFIALEDHAVVAVGYGWKQSVAPPPYLNSHAWEQVESILTVDDNLLPYVCVGRDLMAPPPIAKPAPSYTGMDIVAFIAALPEKIFYSAREVEIYTRDALYEILKLELPMPAEDQLLRRYFVTTVSALRRFARDKSSQLGSELVNMLMRLKSAQFVWVVEYASHEQWSNGHIAARAIIDATASPQDPVPVMFAHGEHKGIFFDREVPALSHEANDLGRSPGTPLGRMELNLRPIREMSKAGAVR